MDKQYWTNYYDEHDNPFAPSPFAKTIANYVKGSHLVELGCGNGRDAIYFSQHGAHVYAVDQCENIVNDLNDRFGGDNLEFIADDFTNMNWNDVIIDNAYSRFTLHSIDEDAEDRVIDWVKNHVSGHFFIEVRSDKDSLVGKTTDHYRRFINFEDLLVKLIRNGFKIEYSEISKGFSQYDKSFGVDYNEDDPTLIRIICKK